jgi:hypothetical protein
MSSLTDEQLSHLTDTINKRLDEFNLFPDTPAFDDISPGIVRIAHDVIVEWLDGIEHDRRDERAEGFRQGAKIGVDVNRIVHVDSKCAHDSDPGDLDDVWPAMPDLTGGVDRFAEHPIAGEPEPPTTLDAQISVIPGPEHTIVTPLRSKLPDSDVARERVAAALANGSGGTLGSVLEKPRADVNGKRTSYGSNDLPSCSALRWVE